MRRLFCLVFLSISVMGKLLSAQSDQEKENQGKDVDESHQKKFGSSHLDLFGQKPPTLRQDLSTLTAVMDADKVASKLRTIANDEMRVKDLQGLFDELPFKRVKLDRSAMLNQLASSLDQSFTKHVKVLNNVRETVSAYHEKSPLDIQVLRSFRGCCSMEQKDLQYDPLFAAWVNTSFSCDIVPPELPKFHFYPGKPLTEVYKRNIGRAPGIRWQYFISSDGSHIEYPAHGSGVSRCLQIEAQRHRAQFLATALPYPKNVVVLLEYGSSFSDSQLQKAKSLAKLLLESFSRQDLVTVLAVSDNVSRPCGDHLLNATWEGKRELSIFLDSLQKQSTPTNHSIGFIEAFKILFDVTPVTRNWSDSASSPHPYIFYISRGLLSSLADAGDVLRTLAKLNLETELNVQINTFAVMDEGKVPMWETQFLKDVAEQNFKKHDHGMSQHLKEALSRRKIAPPIGKMVVVSSSVRETLTLRQVFSLLKKPEANLETSYRDLLSWSEPHVDPVAQPEEGYGAEETLAHQLSRSVISQSLPVWQEEQFVGVVGQDIALGSLTTSLRYFTSQEPGSYVFMVDRQGMVIWHPKLENGIPWVSKVDEVEGRDIWSQIYGKQEGQLQEKNKSYFWITLKNAPYMLIYASDTQRSNEEIPKLSSISASGLKHLTYHRLDLLLNNNIKRHCLNQEQLSTTERGSVYLGPGCFKQPYRHLVTRGETKMIAANYWAHLRDLTKLIKNPGLREGVKEDISALSGIMSDWMRAFKQSKYRKNVLRKYAATHKGVLITYPAGVLNSEYEPTKRDWYVTALQYPGHVVLTAPYLDPSGAGYTVSLSHTVYEGKRAELHHPSDRVVGVVGMDVPLSFVYKLLLETLPVCSKKGMRCILFDNKGYLVAHGTPDSRTQPPVSDREPLEGQHITHKEPILAGDLLEHERLVKKVVCRRLGDRTLQRMYRFNTSNLEALKDKESIGCTRFQLAQVPRSNTFLVILNHTCNQAQSASFCPCSVTDRTCLNCLRSGSTDCECPCECRLRTPRWLEDTCRKNTKFRESNRFGPDKYMNGHVPTCEVAQPPFRLPTLSSETLTKLILNTNRVGKNSKGGNKRLSTLPQCFPIRCGDYTGRGEMGCLGLVGCQWCVKQEDGRTPLDKPHCAPIKVCFGGVKGRSPDGQKQYPDDYLSVSTPVGPVAGGIMAIFVLLVIGVYCYRHQMTRMVEGRAGSAGSGARIHLTGFELEEEEFQFDHDGSKPGNAPANTSQQSTAISHLLLASFERDIPQAVPQPNYRHGPRTESSDHGYSTMTGNCDDSEQATTVGELITPKGKGIQPKLTGTVVFGPKRSGSPGMVPNDKDSAGSLTRLLVKEGNKKDAEATELKPAADKRLSADDLPPPGQTQVGLDRGGVNESDSNTVTIKVQVHAIDTQG